MATKKKGKTVPCEGCRERKKKCTAGQPCERCKRLGIKCYYLKPVLPPKSDAYDSVNNQEIQLHVEFLEDIMRNMERELYLMKTPYLKKEKEEDANNNNNNNNIDSAYSDEDFDHQKSVVEDTTSSSETAVAAANWQLKLRKDGGITINTDILSYTALLKHVQQFGNKSSNLFLFPLVKQPTLVSLSAGGGYLFRQLMSTVVRKGYFKVVTKSIQKKQAQHQLISSASSTHTPTTLLLEAEKNIPPIIYEKKDLHYQLIDCYFTCGGLNRVIYHKKTFYELFMHKNDPTSNPSPAIYALCASILTMHCKHIIDIVPYKQSMQLSDYYFNKARYAVSLQFDEPSLETMITYLHMALFKANTMQPADAKIYLELALRVRQILFETTFKEIPTFYSASTTTTNTTHVDSSDVFHVNQHAPVKKVPRTKLVNSYLGEYETLKRLHAGFQDAAQYIQYVNNQRGVPDKSPKPKKPIFTEKTRMFQSISAEIYNPTPMPDESRDVVRAIMKEHYIARIGRVCGPYFIRVRFGDSDMIPLSYLMKTEEELKHVYFHQIPIEYRLNESIFEDGIDGSEFKKRLADDGRCDVVSVSIASRYYQSLIAIHEPYLPIIAKPATETLVDLSLIHEPSVSDPYLQQRKKKRKRKLQNTTSSVSSSSSEDEGEENVLSVHSLRAQEICYHSAIKVVRLLEYMCTTLGACTIPLPSLLCAWDILMRNSCLGMSEEDMYKSGVSEFLTKKDIQLAQEYAVRCIEVLRRGYMFNGAERDVWEHYEKMEIQLLTALHKSASPTAKYWEPVATW